MQNFPKIAKFSRNKLLFCFFCKISEIFAKRVPKNSFKFLAILRFQKCVYQKEREKCYKMSYWTSKNSPNWPRTSPYKTDAERKKRFSTFLEKITLKRF